MNRRTGEKTLLPLMLGLPRDKPDALALWGFLCQYMDKTRPLPNRPELWQAKVDELAPPPRSRKAELAAQNAVAAEWGLRARAIGFDSELGIPSRFDPLAPDYAHPERRQEMEALAEAFHDRIKAVFGTAPRPRHLRTVLEV